MSKTKIGVFGALLFGVMMLLIPAISIASALEYDRYGKVNDVYYEDDIYYKEIQYDDRNGYYEDEYVYEENYYPPKDKKKQEPSMLLVKKDVLYCDGFSGSGQACRENGKFVGPDSGRYVQECTGSSSICTEINESSFDMVVTDNIEFPGSEKGKKLSFNGERYTVTEEFNLGIIQQTEFNNLLCQESGFDSGFFINLFNGPQILICVLNEGECSGIIQDGELKECDIKNYVISGSN